MNSNVIIPAASLAIQVASIFFTVRLWRTTGRHAISAVLMLIISLMAFRRAISLEHSLAGGTIQVDLAAELLALVISCLILFAISYIARLISQEQATQQAVASAEGRYRTLFDQSPDGVLLIDARGAIVDFNDQTCRQLGYTREEFNNLTIADIDPVESHEEISHSLEEVAKQGSAEFEVKHRTKSGEIRDVYIITKTVTLSGQTFYHTIWRDITERKKAEKALAESESRYRTLFDQSPDGIVLVGMDGKIVEFNESACRDLGYTREEFARLSIWDLDPVETPEDVQARLRGILREGKASFYVKHRTKQGELRDIHVIINIVTLSGIPVGHAIWHDITDIKKMRDELEEKTSVQNAILENALVGIAFLNDRKFIWINSKMEQVFGYTRAELDGLKTEILYPSEEEYEQFGEDAYPLLAKGGTYSRERLMKRKDGSLFWCSLSGKAIVADTLAKGSIWILQDISERKAAEEKIRQSEQFIRGILDTVDEGFIVIDQEYRILTANKAYCEQVGADCDAIVGISCYEIAHGSVRPCFEEAEDCAPRRVFETGKPCSAFHKHRDEKGRILYVETKAFPIKDNSGTVTSVIETINNITEKHLLEEERLKTQKLESIGTLAGGIAHDFNNLLQGIFGYLSMAKLSLGEPAKTRTMLEQAEKALHQSVNLTTQLLTFSKGGKPVMKTLSLLPVIENAVTFALSGSRCTYEVRINPDVWLVEADEGQLGQVIQNIVLNADQAMPLGGNVVISARNLPGDDASLPLELGGRDAVLITIQDSGVGISEQYLSKIFDPYFTTKEKGSGLGLATTYSIVKNHGGLVRVKSAVDAGTTFFLYLPASGKSEEETASPVIRPRQGTGRVLVMDDEEVIRLVMAEMLSALGHEAVFAPKGENAIEAYNVARIENRPFDIVILDLTIRGGMGGAETLQRLLEIDPGVKAVVSSGYSDDAIAAGYEEQGFKAFLKKPYNIEELQEVLNRLLHA
jgi:PAS domain S-box-containing protein